MKIIRLILVLALAVGTTSPLAFAETKNDTTAAERVVEIFLHQAFSPKSTSGPTFYMWVLSPNVYVKNTPPNLTTGFSIGPGGGFYITKKDTNHWHGMFFVHNYDGGDFPGKVVLWFGGDRDDDIHIRLPEGAAASVSVNTVQ